MLTTEPLEDLVHEASPVAGLELVDVVDIVLLAHVEHLLEEVASRTTRPRLQRSGRQQRVGDRQLRMLADVSLPLAERIAQPSCDGIEAALELGARPDERVPRQR